MVNGLFFCFIVFYIYTVKLFQDAVVRIMFIRVFIVPEMCTHSDSSIKKISSSWKLKQGTGRTINKTKMIMVGYLRRI